MKWIRLGIILIILTASIFTEDGSSPESEESPVPEIEWTRTYGGPAVEEGRSIQLTPDGGYIICGRTESYGAGGSDAWVLKLDAHGDLQWNRTYGGAGIESGFDVIPTNDGGYILWGNTDSSYESTGQWLMKLNINGEIEWEKILRVDGGNTPVLRTLDHGYLVLGKTWRRDSEGFSWPDIWVGKYSNTGVAEWNHSLEEYGAEIARDLTLASEGGYLLVGTRAPPVDFGGSNVWVVELDATGDVKWSQEYGISGWDASGRAVHSTRDGGYIIAGNALFQGKADFWLGKLTEGGVLEWNHTYGGDKPEDVRSVLQTTDGGYLIAGSTQSYGVGDADGWLVKTNSSGFQEWTLPLGGLESEIVYEVQQTIEGGYIMVALTSSYGAGRVDIWVVKLYPEETVATSTQNPPLRELDTIWLILPLLVLFLGYRLGKRINRREYQRDKEW